MVNTGATAILYLEVPLNCTSLHFRFASYCCLRTTGFKNSIIEELVPATVPHIKLLSQCRVSFYTISITPEDMSPLWFSLEWEEDLTATLWMGGSLQIEMEKRSYPMEEELEWTGLDYKS